MICASVPLWKVSSHLDATLGDGLDTSPTCSLDSLLGEAERDDAPADSREPVFLLTAARRAVRCAA